MVHHNEGPYIITREMRYNITRVPSVVDATDVPMLTVQIIVRAFKAV